MIRFNLSAGRLIFGIKLLFSDALLNRYPAVEEDKYNKTSIESLITNNLIQRRTK